MVALAPKIQINKKTCLPPHKIYMRDIIVDIGLSRSQIERLIFHVIYLFILIAYHRAV